MFKSEYPLGMVQLQYKATCSVIVWAVLYLALQLFVKQRQSYRDKDTVIVTCSQRRPPTRTHSSHKDGHGLTMLRAL